VTPAEQIEQQAATIDRIRRERGDLRRRCEIQQWLINKLKAEIEQLQAQATPEAIAERIFK
jgi:predicted RNase H-like nuclease (RuvC/YqgF family)